MNKHELFDKFEEPIKVGHLGFVKLIDVMGNDAAITQAARVSYGAGTKSISEDKALIRYLMRHRHTSPLEMCEIKIHIKAPIHVFRQMFRHRAASINEVSTRYSEVQDEFELFEADKIRVQSKDNKQGSSGYLKDESDKPYSFTDSKGVKHEGFATAENRVHRCEFLANDAIDCSFSSYRELIQDGIAREQARNVLPLATYSEAYWKIDLHNLFHFLKLRLDSHAQLEIREFAEAIASIVKEWVPVAYEAFVDYQLEGAYFSKQELLYVAAMLAAQGDIKYHQSQLTDVSKREQKEFLEKLGFINE